MTDRTNLSDYAKHRFTDCTKLSNYAKLRWTNVRSPRLLVTQSSVCLMMHIFTDPSKKAPRDALSCVSVTPSFVIDYTKLRVIDLLRFAEAEQAGQIALPRCTHTAKMGWLA